MQIKLIIIHQYQLFVATFGYEILTFNFGISETIRWMNEKPSFKQGLDPLSF